jgi:predicted deacetylase
MSRRAIVSVHDLMPSTMGHVMKVLDRLEELRVPPATLLVVPGRDWSPQQIGVLHALAERGHTLAGHGWVHKASPGPRTLYHRAHGLLISRNEAEHLSRSSQELFGMVQDCFRWFGQVDLPEPELYVPPAWAMGQLRRGDLQRLPFRWYEVLPGLVDGPTGRLRWLPLAGFEADTTFRKVGLRVWNGCNALLAKRSGVPLRISIHPQDLELLMREDVKRLVGSGWEFLREEEVMGPLSSWDRP